MTSPVPTTRFTEPASEERLERVAAALKENNFGVEILDDVAAARDRIKELIPEGATVFTGSSETLRLSGIDDDLNLSGRWDAVKARSTTMDRATQLAEIWRMIAGPDFIVGSAAAVTETGALVFGSAMGSQLAGYSGAAQGVVWVIGAQKVVADVSEGLDRLNNHCYPLEDERAKNAYGVGSALNRILILNKEPHPGRATVLLLREAIGF